MEYAQLGVSGLRVSRLGLGMMSYGDPSVQPWALRESEAEPIVRAAVAAGVNLFDTADMYSDGASEEVTGRLLRKVFVGREDYVLATKVYYPTGTSPNDRGLSRKHILAGIDASLRRLGVDYVDIYQIHRFDPDTPVLETMLALEEVVRSGRARYIGASSMYAWQFAKLQNTALARGLTPFTSMQNRSNLVNREDERELIPMCLDMGVGLLPYSPLARGLLAGTRERGRRGVTRRSAETHGDRDEDYDVQERLLELASQRGMKPAVIALAWLLQRPGVCAPILGATNTGHVEDAVGALSLRLTEAETADLERAYAPRLLSTF